MEDHQTIQFRLALAGLLLDVDCCHESTRRLCADYLTEESHDPDLRVTVTPEDLQWERQRLLRRNDPWAKASPQAIESLSLSRKIAEFLPSRDRLLFHGSCLAYEGQGILFTAKSGTGKSTHTRLWRQCFPDRVVMVNDDKPFLHITEGQVTVWGNPWQGKHHLGANMTVPLKAICILTRGTENRIRRISAREALPMLLQQTYRPRGSQMLGKTLTLLDTLSERVALYHLSCNMDPEAAQTALAGLDAVEK